MVTPMLQLFLLPFPPQLYPLPIRIVGPRGNLCEMNVPELSLRLLRQQCQHTLNRSHNRNLKDVSGIGTKLSVAVIQNPLKIL